MFLHYINNQSILCKWRSNYFYFFIIIDQEHSVPSRHELSDFYFVLSHLRKQGRNVQVFCLKTYGFEHFKSNIFINAYWKIHLLDQLLTRNYQCYTACIRRYRISLCENTRKKKVKIHINIQFLNDNLLKLYFFMKKSTVKI